MAKANVVSSLKRGFKREAKPRPTRREALELRPIRNPALEWAENEETGNVVLTIVRPKTWKTRLIGVFVPIPETHPIALDAIGSDVWRLCDGENSLRAIAKTLEANYQLLPREAEISTGQFFKDLGRRGFIALLKPEPKPATPSKRGRKKKP